MVDSDLEKGLRWSRISFPEKTESVLTGSTCEEPSSSIATLDSRNTIKTPHAEGAQVDGGWVAWLSVFGAFLALMCTFGQLSSFGTFQSWYSEHQLSHLPPSTISWIGSAQLWVFFFSGGFIGRLFDAYGPRLLMIPGTIVLVASIMLTSLCKSYYQYILAQGVLFGLGVGLLFYSSLSAISTLFIKYRATALGIALAGSGLGGVVYPIMLQRLFTSCGFAWGVRISGFLSLASCSIACCTVSAKQATKRNTAAWFSMSCFHDARYLLLIISSVFIALGLFVPNFYIVSYATDHHVSSNIAFYILAVLNAGGIVGRILPSYLSDKVGRFNILVPCVFFTGLSTLVFWMFARTLVPIMLYAVTYGFFSGAFNALIMPCIAQISDISEIGTRIGMLYSILSFPSLAGGPAAGALLKLQHGSYTGMIAMSGATLIVGSFFALWARLRIDNKLFARV